VSESSGARIDSGLADGRTGVPEPRQQHAARQRGKTSVGGLCSEDSIVGASLAILAPSSASSISLRDSARMAFDAISQSGTFAERAGGTQTEGYSGFGGKTDVSPLALEDDNAFHTGLDRVMACYYDLVSNLSSIPGRSSYDSPSESLAIALGEALRALTATSFSLDSLLSLREKKGSDIIESIQMVNHLHIIYTFIYIGTCQFYLSVFRFFTHIPSLSPQCHSAYHQACKLVDSYLLHFEWTRSLLMTTGSTIGKADLLMYTGDGRLEHQLPSKIHG
jgi:hypothetical protein